MTEQDYQADVKELWTELEQRAATAIDYLITQPPLRLARIEIRALLEWAMEMGAEHPQVVTERLRRKRLAARTRDRSGHIPAPFQSAAGNGPATARRNNTSGPLV